MPGSGSRKHATAGPKSQSGAPPIGLPGSSSRTRSTRPATIRSGERCGGLGARVEPFVDAVDAARFGPPAGAGAAARQARRELRRVERELRANLSRFERARGLLSLRSLGFSG